MTTNPFISAPVVQAAGQLEAGLDNGSNGGDGGGPHWTTKLRRMIRHILGETIMSHEALDPEVRRRISHACVHDADKHEGRILVVAEKSLSAKRLLRHITAKQRALEVFAKRNVWDTEYNCGVLIYLLVSERKVELVVDRALDRAVDETTWQDIIRMMENDFRRNSFETGLVAGIERIRDLLIKHFPSTESAADDRT